MTTLLPDGRRMDIYSYTHATTRASTFIPIVGAVVGGADVRGSTVTLTYDANGVLANYSASSMQSGATTGLVAGGQSHVAQRQSPEPGDLSTASSVLGPTATQQTAPPAQPAPKRCPIRSLTKPDDVSC
jgi:hypothetical protein